uniref:Large ribosomal subunit protein mL54 n=1 Tax=Angiostrongylus cantonensis TaxID=6313 RepID=A0A0K0CZV6_ANGCA
MLCRYATVGSKVVQTKADKSAIEEDAEKLANYVCINYFIQDNSQFSGDEPGPKILPDSEYPSWLFELDLRPARPLEDLDPEKDGWLYWRALRIRQIEQNRRIQKLKTRFLHLQSSPSMKKFRRF